MTVVCSPRESCLVCLLGGGGKGQAELYLGVAAEVGVGVGYLLTWVSH